jgi:hypothetical protein
MAAADTGAVTPFWKSAAIKLCEVAIKLLGGGVYADGYQDGFKACAVQEAQAAADSVARGDAAAAVAGSMSEPDHYARD